MTPLPSDKPASGSARGLFWASAAFYILIAFEFFYMASPFAAYFYAVYGPGLDWLQQLGFSGWTLWFFLPPLVEETRSSVINNAEALGLVLFAGGLAVFAIGAFQVYRNKLRGGAAVTKGLYRYIRHPQYTALILASLGMLLVWPRFLVLFSTVTVIFAYAMLARAEESICLKKFPEYTSFRDQTGMFLPKSWTPFHLPPVKNRVLRCLLWVAALIVTIIVTTYAAFGIRQVAIQSLYTYPTDEGVYLSIIEIADADLVAVATIARNAPDALAALDPLDPGERILAYVLPTEMYVSEIPMQLPEGQTFGHSIPTDRDPERLKVIFTRAEFTAGGLPEGGGIIAHAVNKYPLVEVHVNLEQRRVEASFPPPADTYYADIQVPLF